MDVGREVEVEWKNKTNYEYARIDVNNPIPTDTGIHANNLQVI